MSDLNSYGFGNGATVATAQTRNRVLRNTYALLALSMVPTVICLLYTSPSPRDS